VSSSSRPLTRLASRLTAALSATPRPRRARAGRSRSAGYQSECLIKMDRLHLIRWTVATRHRLRGPIADQYCLTSPAHPTRPAIRSPVRQKGALSRKIRLQWKERYPTRYRIFRRSPIFRDLPGARRTTAHRRTTTHTGIAAGPDHQAGAGAERPIEVTGQSRQSRRA
jgi:hypothetical protein